ncbi:MAG: hypothetical protein R2694_06560 [Ilumatobacteraceae bacterium]
MSRMIGKASSLLLSTSTSIGPTSAIWCTAGVSGIVAPAMAAMRGLHTPQAMATYSHSMRPLLVTTAVTLGRPPGTGSVSMSSTSVLANTWRAPLATASSRMDVPDASESTTLTLGV